MRPLAGNGVAAARASGLAWLGVALTVVFSQLPRAPICCSTGSSRRHGRRRAAREHPGDRHPGGGQHRNAPEYGGATVNRLTLERLRYGARLEQRLADPRERRRPRRDPEASLMKAALEEDFRVAVKWTESASRDTRENARFSAALLLCEESAASCWSPMRFTCRVPRPSSGPQASRSPRHRRPGSAAQAGRNESWISCPRLTAPFAGWLAAHEWLGNPGLPPEPLKPRFRRRLREPAQHRPPGRPRAAP